MEPGVLDRLRLVPSGAGFPGTGSRADASRWPGDLWRSGGLDGGIRHYRLPKNQLSMSEMRRTVLLQIRQSPVENVMAAQPIRPLLHTLWFAEVGCECYSVSESTSLNKQRITRI